MERRKSDCEERGKSDCEERGNGNWDERGKSDCEEKGQNNWGDRVSVRKEERVTVRKEERVTVRKEEREGRVTVRKEEWEGRVTVRKEERGGRIAVRKEERVTVRKDKNDWKKIEEELGTRLKSALREEKDRLVVIVREEEVRNSVHPERGQTTRLYTNCHRWSTASLISDMKEDETWVRIHTLRARHRSFLGILEKEGV